MRRDPEWERIAFPAYCVGFCAALFVCVLIVAALLLAGALEWSA